jgi:hypothetical protein
MNLPPEIIKYILKIKYDNFKRKRLAVFWEEYKMKLKERNELKNFLDVIGFRNLPHFMNPPNHLMELFARRRMQIEQPYEFRIGGRYFPGVIGPIEIEFDLSDTDSDHTIGD